MRIASPTTRRDRSPFFGRSLDLELLQAQLASGAGLVTLTGPSGIGKTRLARQLAGVLNRTASAEERVWFCSLAGCTTAADLEAVVARTLGIWQQQGDDLARAISSRGPLLLILDNADATAPGSEKVLEAWLERCVELQLVVTSLAPMGLEGEFVLELQPLDLDDAVALYLERARQAWADRAFDQDELPAVQDLVRRLDRLPLAIELAAARVRILPPRAMLSMLERRFEILRASRPASKEAARPLPRSASLLGALEFTWSHLDLQDRLALARASVFEDGFGLEAALALLGDPSPDAGAGSDPQRILHTLESLRRKSLILQDDAGQPRYLLQESVKAYARQELRRMNRWDETVHRHASYFLNQKSSRAAWAEGPDETTSLPWLQAERANIVAIHRRFLREDPSIAARAGLALVPLLHWEGQHDPASELPSSIFDAARRSEDPDLLLRALSFIGNLHFKYGHFEPAAGFYDEAARLARAIGDQAMEVRALSDLALVYLARDGLERSRQPLERALHLVEGLESPAVEGIVRLAQGYAALHLGALDEAESSHAKAVALLRRHGRPGNSANACYSLGLTLASQRKFDEARRLFDEALEACKALGYRALEAHVLAHASVVELADGRLNDAKRICLQSLAIHRKIGNRFREGEGHCTLGIIALEQGDLEAAEQSLGQAVELFSACGAAASREETLIFLSILEAKRGNVQEALRIFEEVEASPREDTRRSRAVGPEDARPLLHAALARTLRTSEPEKAELRIEAARRHLAESDSSKIRLPSFLPVLPRLLAKMIAEWDAGMPPPTPAPKLLELLVGPDFGWFQVTGGRRVDLRIRPILRQIFVGLARAAIDSPGAPVEPSRLIELGWPGVETDPIRIKKRLHMTIWTLRDLGLRSIILNEEDGYLLDPAVPIREVDEPVRDLENGRVEAKVKRCSPSPRATLPRSEAREPPGPSPAHESK